jgi:hypothetical protein
VFDGCYGINTQSLTWIAAGIAAAQQNATLAPVHSVAHMRWIYELGGNLLQRVNLHRGTGVWLGLNDISAEGRLQNADGSPADVVGWGPGEPNGRSAENCVALGLNAAVFDVACDTSWQSILKWNASAAVAPEGLTTLICFVHTF